MTHAPTGTCLRTGDKTPETAPCSEPPGRINRPVTQPAGVLQVWAPGPELAPGFQTLDALKGLCEGCPGRIQPRGTKNGGTDAGVFRSALALRLLCGPRRLPTATLHFRKVSSSLARGPRKAPAGPQGRWGSPGQMTEDVTQASVGQGLMQTGAPNAVTGRPWFVWKRPLF